MMTTNDEPQRDLVGGGQVTGFTAAQMPSFGDFNITDWESPLRELASGESPHHQAVVAQDSGIHKGNFYGLIESWYPEGKAWLPIMCGCGGSMYVCRKHHEQLAAILTRQKQASGGSA